MSSSTDLKMKPERGETKTVKGADGFLKIWQWAVIGAPLWWVLGLNLFFYHFFALVIFLGMVHRYDRQQRPIHVSATSILLLLIVAAYGFSVGIHSFSSDASRVVAASYNLSFWVMGLMVIVVLTNTFTREGVRHFLNAFLVFSCVTAVLAIVGWSAILLGLQTVIFPTPLYGLGQLLGRTVLVENSLSVVFLELDWFVSLGRPRFNVYSPYPTAAGGIFMIVLMMLFTWASIRNKLKNPLFIALFLVNLMALGMTLSRMSMIAFLLSTMIVFVFQKQRSLPWILISLILIALVTPWIDKVVEIILGAREGSNISRAELYIYSLEQLRSVDWILGLGLKPREEVFHFPIGSHSTYLSLLFKSGMIGFLSFVIFQITLLVRWYTLKRAVLERREDFLFWRGLGLVFVAMGFWMLTEDIDAPQLLAFLYFSCIGAFEGFRRTVLS